MDLSIVKIVIQAAKPVVMGLVVILASMENLLILLIQTNVLNVITLSVLLVQEQPLIVTQIALTFVNYAMLMLNVLIARMGISKVVEIVLLVIILPVLLAVEVLRIV